MKPHPFMWICTLAVGVWLIPSPVLAKPPGPGTKEPAKKPTAAPTPALTPPLDSAADSALARWLVQTPSGSDAILLPFAQVVNAATSRHLLPFEPANPVDAGILVKIGAALDALLPRMNQSDSSARASAATGGSDAVCARFEGELSAALQSPPPPTGSVLDHSYPVLSFSDAATGKNYYLAVALSAPGGGITPAVTFRPSAAVNRLTTDGCSLLVSIESNGKMNHDIAFLNWQVLDLSRLKVRFVPIFQADPQEAIQPGAVLTDGRKGRD